MDLLVVDAFASEPFRGNPAGVCFLDEARPDAWMASVAAEMKHSETAFLLARDRRRRTACAGSLPRSRSPCAGTRRSRARTCCGTRAGSTVAREATFHTLSGVLRARSRPDGAIELDFPVATLEARARDRRGRRARRRARRRSLRTTSVLHARRARRRGHGARRSRPTSTRVRALDTDAVSTSPPRPTIPRSTSVPRASRPRVGIDEDPVTGSMHVRARPVLARSLRRRAARRAGLRPRAANCTCRVPATAS